MPCFVSMARLKDSWEFSCPSAGKGIVRRLLGDVFAMRGSEVDEVLLRVDGLGAPAGVPDWLDWLRGVTARRDQEPSERTGAKGDPPPQKEAPLGEFVALWPRPDSFC